MRIVLVCPIYPPRPGGLADHTAAWARAIGGHLGHEVVVLTGPGAEDQHDPRVSLAEPLEVWHGARFREAILALQPDLIMFQYVPHLYQRHGLSWLTVRTLETLARQGMPIVTLAHELYYGRWEAWKHQPVGWIQRAALWPLFRASRRVVFSVRAREQRMREVFPTFASRFSTLPVGTNFVLPGGDAFKTWRRDLGVTTDELLVLFQGGPHPSKDLQGVRVALDRLLGAGIPVRLLSIGGTVWNHPAAIDLGHVPVLEACWALQAADLALTPFVDGVSGRRGSVMNALAAGLPTISTFGRDTDEDLFPDTVVRLVPPRDALALAEATLSLAQDESARKQMSQAARAWFEAHFSWPVLASAWSTILDDAVAQ